MVGVGLDALADEEPDSPALSCAGVTLSRSELASRSNRLARHLAGLGVGQDDLVTIGLPNGLEFFVAAVAAWKLGATPQPVSARLPTAEMSGLLRLADSPVVVGLDPGDGRPWLPIGFVPDAALDDSPLPPATPASWKAPTSGGSTGRPKIILAGGAGTVEAIGARGPAMRIAPDEVFLVTAPLYHRDRPQDWLSVAENGGLPRRDCQSRRDPTGSCHRWKGIQPTSTC